MRRIPVIMLFAIVSATELFAQPLWKRVTPGDHLYVLTDVAIPDARTVLVTTSADILWRSVDSGKTFTVAKYPLAMPLAGISFCDSLHGMAVGPNGAAARTTDGGASWTGCPMPASMKGQAVACITPMISVVVSDAKRVLRSSDAGGTWTEITIPDWAPGYRLRSIVFTDSLTGYCCGLGTAGVLKSKDGGFSWRRQNMNGVGDLLNLRFATPLFGYVAAASTLLRTSNGGDTWTPVPGYGKAVAIVGGDGLLAMDAQHIARSTDSARSWKDVSFEAGASGKLSAIATGPGGLCAAVGAGGGMVLISSDSGRTWRQTAGRLDAHPLVSMAFPDPGRGYLLSTQRRFFRSADSGASWQYLVLPAAGECFDLHFTARDSGWAAGANGTLLRTVDAGASWTRVESGVSVPLRSIAFFDARRGLIAGDSGVLLRTTDGGNTWTRLWSGTRAALLSVYWSGPLSAVAVGAKGTMLQTFDGGERWLRVNVGVAVGISSVHFTDGFTGIASGSAFSGCLRSTDGGETWSATEFYVLRTGAAVTVAADAQWNFAGGNTANLLWESVDGGNSWSVNEPMHKRNFALRGIAFPHPSIAYLGFDSANIYRGTHIRGAGPRLSVSSSRGSFGRRAPDTTITRSIFLANTGLKDLRIDGIDIIGPDSLDFSILPYDHAVVTPLRGRHEIGIAFRSHTPGLKKAFARIRSNDDSASTRLLPLEGSIARPSWQCSAERVRFGDVSVGSSTERTLTLTCIDSAALPFPAFAIEGDDSALYTMTGGASGLCQPGQNITITLRFSPTREGRADIALLRFRTSGDIAPYSTVMLEGTGVVAKLRFSPDTVRFSTVGAGQWKDDSVSVRNIGSGPATLGSMTIGGADAAAFRIIRALPARIERGDSAVAVLRFSPAREGTHNAVLDGAHGDPSTPDIRIPMSGYGFGPLLDADRAAFDFGYVLAGAVYRDTLTVRNAGYLPLHITRQEFAGPSAKEVRILLPLPAVLLPSEAAPFVIEYAPLVDAPAGRALMLVSDDTWSRADTLPLRAVVVRGIADAMPDSVFCDTARVRSWLQRTFWIRNNSSVTVWIAGWTLTGPGSSAFTADPELVWIKSGLPATIRVRFHPLVAGLAEALLLVHMQDSLRGYDIPVRLAGVGTDVTSTERLPAADGFRVSAVYPQPVSGIAVVTISLSVRAHVLVTVLDALGRRVAILADTEFSEGDHAVTLDASALPPGPYLLVLDAAGTRQSTRLLLVK